MARKYRRYVTDENSKPLAYQTLTKVSVLLAIADVIIYVLYRVIGTIDLVAPFAHYLKYVLIAVSLLLVVTLAVAVWRNGKRELVATLADDRNGTASPSKRASRRIRQLTQLFNDKAIIDVLKFGNATKYGVEMPTVQVFVADDLLSGYVAVENIGNYDKLDASKMEQKVSGRLSGKFQQYAVVSSELVQDDSFIKFYFEDVNVSHRLTLKLSDIEKYKSDDKHAIRVMDNLTLTFGSNVHHMAITARTRSGKSVLAHYMATLMKAQGWRVEYNSAKLDRVVKEFKGQSDPEKIVERAEYWVTFMERRLAKINKANKDKYTEIPGMRDVGLFFDELGNLNAAISDDKKLKLRWTKAVNKLTATGASAGVHVIAISQYATIDGLGLPTLARANVADAVIMLGEAANQATERQFLMPGFADLPSRKYKVGQGLGHFTLIDGWQSPHLFEAPFIKS